MTPLLDKIERTYLDRCENNSTFKKLWQEAVSEYPPDISRCLKSPRPSLSLSRDAGDLGLAIMWIVQTAIVRPILNDIGIIELPIGEGKAASAHHIGALAHSEDRNFPAIINESTERIIVSGKKKYITGGTNADFLLLTARREGDDNTTALIVLPKEAIAPESFKNLTLPMLRTIEHASLELHECVLSRENLMPIEPSHLRRSLKRWSIIERAFIAEAFIGLCAYIAIALEHSNLMAKSMHPGITSLLEKLEKNVTQMLNTALMNERIPDILPFDEIIKCYVQLKESLPPSSSLPPELRLRLSDLALFEKMKS